MFDQPATFPAILLVSGPSLAVFHIFSLSLFDFFWLIGLSHAVVNLGGRTAG